MDVKSEKYCQYNRSIDRYRSIMQYTISVVGDNKCGKTQFISRMCTGDFTKKYVPTNGFPITMIHENTNLGDITFKVYENYPDEADVHVDGAIIMIDLQNPKGLDNVMQNVDMLERLHPGLPIILCGNKCDVKGRKIPWKSIREVIPKDFRHPYYDVSARSNFKLTKPWLDIAKVVSGHKNLCFDGFYPGLAAPEVVLEGGKMQIK